MASNVSKLTKLMNQTSISSLKSAIKPSTSCKPTPLFRQFSLFRSPLELGATQLMMPLLSAGKMSACMSTSTKSGKSAKKGKSRNTGRVRSAPENPKFPKEHKGTMKGIAHKGNYIAFGKYALQALDHSWISARQLEAGRKALVQYARRNGKIWIRIFPRKPITIRPAETRMGRGKGACAFWVAVVQPGRILYEMAGVTESIARLAIKVAASKMPVKTRFISLE